MTQVQLVEEAFLLIEHRYCACGCGKTIPHWNRNYRSPEYIRGHNEPGWLLNNWNRNQGQRDW